MFLVVWFSERLSQKGKEAGRDAGKREREERRGEERRGRGGDKGKCKKISTRRNSVLLAEIRCWCVGFRPEHDTFIDPVASNVYESLFEREDESIDARQVHAWLKHASLFLLCHAFDAHYQDSPFIQTPEMLAALLNPTGALRGSRASIVRLYFSF